MDFIEVETPTLQSFPGVDLHVTTFITELMEPFTRKQLPFYLHTSPEITMKKLLAAGLPRIFQLARVYRNGERSPIHYPEFTLLEWYRTGVNYCTIMDDCEALFRSILTMTCPQQKGFTWNGRQCNPCQPWQRLSVVDAFAERTGINLLDTLTDLIEPSPIPLAEAAHLPLSLTDRWEDIFFRIMLERIEPHLGNDRPVILYDYPTPLAALSRSKADDPRLSERFEVYICGVEIANAYSELNDASIQRARLLHESKIRGRLYSTCTPIDEDFLDTLAYMPEAAGAALGIDRLVMLAVGADTIEDVLWAPIPVLVKNI